MLGPAGCLGVELVQCHSNLRAKPVAGNGLRQCSHVIDTGAGAALGAEILELRLLRLAGSLRRGCLLGLLTQGRGLALLPVAVSTRRRSFRSGLVPFGFLGPLFGFRGLPFGFRGFGLLLGFGRLGAAFFVVALLCREPVGLGGFGLLLGFRGLGAALVIFALFGRRDLGLFPLGLETRVVRRLLRGLARRLAFRRRLLQDLEPLLRADRERRIGIFLDEFLERHWIR